MKDLSHDVRTPLATLLGYLDAVYGRRARGEEWGDYLETARKKAYDLKEYINMLFDWFRLNSGEFTLRMESLELGEATRNILIDWIPVLEEKEVEYEAGIPDRPVWVRLDLEGYRRILNNLMQNVLAHSEGSRVEICLSERGSRAEVILRDNGVGIKQEEADRIFDRLYKCDRGRGGQGGESADFRDAARGRNRSAVEDALGIVGLPKGGRKLFSQYSLGMKQRLAIALAVLHDPELLILDVKWSMVLIVYCVYSVQKKRGKGTLYTNRVQICV